MAKKDIPELTAVVQRDGETYAIVPRISCGLIPEPALLRKLADVAERYGAQALKITSSQRIAIIGLQEQDLEAVWQELGMKPGFATGMCVRSVKACPGTSYCKLGQQDALGLGLQLEEELIGTPLPNKLKMAVSGCPLCCAESYVRDVGLIGTKKGYTLALGGSAAGRPRIAQVFAEELAPEAVLPLVRAVIEAYRQQGRRKRLGDVLEEQGLSAFRAAVEEARQP